MTILLKVKIINRKLLEIFVKIHKMSSFTANKEK